MIYVVGSGPSGVSVAMALLDLGHEVCMLDYGLTLEPDRAAILAELKNLTPEQWSPEKINYLKGSSPVSTRGVEYKNIFGSDFPYREADFVDVPPKGIEVKPSMAAGGLSNVWGAAILPTPATDMSDWPLKPEDLAPHYQAVLSFLNVCGSRDGLEPLFPIFSNHLQNLRLSRQSRQLLDKLNSRRAELAQSGFHFGQARLAVRAENSREGPGCVYCGLCLYGCPYDLIYNSIQTVKNLKENPRFSYKPGVNVQTVEEASAGIVIHGILKNSADTIALKGDRVYLAAGPFSSTKIFLESSSSWEKEIQLKTSQYFMVPFLSHISVKYVRQEPLHTLSQIFIELQDKQISPHYVHLQFYSYNDMLQSFIRGKLGIFSRLVQPVTDYLLGRLFIIQSFLHSDDSSLIGAKLMKKDGKTMLSLHPMLKQRPKEMVKKVLAKLGKYSPALSGRPLPFLLHFGALGDGNHTGGSFPMRQKPGPFETDIAGRPHGFSRIHIADSSVLPSLPGTTITLTIMANAHRLASMEKEL